MSLKWHYTLMCLSSIIVFYVSTFLNVVYACTHLIVFCRKMQVSGANDLASKGHGVLDSSNMKVKGEIDDPFQSDVKVRCPCGSSLETESMIKVIPHFSGLVP